MIDREDMERLKEVFVTRQECNTQMDDVDKKLSNDNARLVIIEHQLLTITKMLYAIGSGILVLILGSLWNLIAK